MDKEESIERAGTDELFSLPALFPFDDIRQPYYMSRVTRHHYYMKTEAAFNAILESSLFRLNGPQIDLPAALISLCDAIKAEEETDWSLGEHSDCSLDNLLIGAYWSLSEWHAGQASPEYAALCAIGSIFSPGHTSPPTSDDEPEYWPYVAVNNHFARIHNRPEEIKL